MNLTDARLARVALSIISEPGDTVTGTLLQLLGAPDTLRMVSTRESLPDTIDPTEGQLWRARLAPRLRDADTERVVGDSERRGLTVLTPDDPRLPAALSQLGVSPPVAMWIARSERAIAREPLRGVATVGARAATSNGEHVAAELGSEVAGIGVSIVSGGDFIHFPRSCCCSTTGERRACESTPGSLVCHDSAPPRLRRPAVGHP